MLCDTCGKKGYATEAIAKQRLKQIKADRHKKRCKPERVYYSQRCGCWHLTSQQPRTFGAGTPDFPHVKE